MFDEEEIVFKGHFEIQAAHVQTVHEERVALGSAPIEIF